MACGISADPDCQGKLVASAGSLTWTECGRRCRDTAGCNSFDFQQNNGIVTCDLYTGNISTCGVQNFPGYLYSVDCVQDTAVANCGVDISCVIGAPFQSIADTTWSQCALLCSGLPNCKSFQRDGYVCNLFSHYQDIISCPTGQGAFYSSQCIPPSLENTPKIPPRCGAAVDSACKGNLITSTAPQTLTECSEQCSNTENCASLEFNATKFESTCGLYTGDISFCAASDVAGSFYSLDCLPATSVANCGVEIDFDIHTSPDGTFTNVTWSQCAALCRALPNCKSFSHLVPTDPFDPTPKCELYSGSIKSDATGTGAFFSRDCIP